jgi:hypothetical protein
LNSDSGEVAHYDDTAKAQAHRLQDALRAQGHHAVVAILPEGSYEVSTISGKLTCIRSWTLKYRIEPVTEPESRWGTFQTWAEAVRYSYERSQQQELRI